MKLLKDNCFVKKHECMLYISIIFLIFLINILLYYKSGSNYFWRPTDIQEDYFYGSLLLHQNLPILRPSHPGVPAYRILSWIFDTVGNPIEQAEDVFLIAYSLLLAVSVVSFSIFVSTPKRIPAPYRLLALSFLFAWPPAFFYALTYGADSFVLPLSVLITGLLWRFLDGERSRHPWWLWVVFGCLCGTAISTKLTLIIPVASAFLALLTLAIVNRSPRLTRAIALSLSAAIGTAATLLFPVLWRVASYVTMLIRPPDYLQASGGILGRLPTVIDRMASGNAMAEVVLLVLLGASIVGVCLATYAVLRHPENRVQLFPKTIFVLTMFIGLLLTAGGVLNGRIDAPGVALRNASAAIVAIPAGLFLLFEARPSRLQDIAWPKVVSIAVSTFLVVFATYSTVQNRDAHTAMRQELQKKWDTAISLLAGPGLTVAVAEGANEAAFHYYGNNAYAADHFDERISAVFPETSYVRRNVLTQVTSPPPSPPRGLGRIWQGVKRHWYRLFPLPPIPTPSRFLVPPQPPRELSGVIIRRSQLPPGCAVACFAGYMNAQGYDMAPETGDRVLSNDFLVFRNLQAKPVP